MKRIALAVAVLMATTLLPVNRAEARSLVTINFDGEGHLVFHRCSTIKKVLGVCGLKQGPVMMTFYASEAKKPQKNGNLTRCFGFKLPVQGKAYGLRGPFCDLHFTAALAKPAGMPFLGFCEATEGPMVGSYTVYEAHGGPAKKVTNFAGTFFMARGIGTFTALTLKKNKPQGGDLQGVIRFSLAKLARDVSKGDTDDIEDCSAPATLKDDPQQVGVTGNLLERQENV